jgi:integrase
MPEFDPKLLAALKLIAERPEILQAAMALAQGQVVQDAAPKPTVAALWDAYALVAPSRLAKGSWRSRLSYRKTFGRLVLKLDDGTESTIVDLPYDQVTPRVAELYRIAREKEDNGQGGTVAPGTVNRELGTLQAMFQWHTDIKKTIPHNPLKGWHRTDESGSGRQTYLTPEQARRFIEAGPPLFQDVALVAYRCAGLRHAEARLLRKSEVDFAAKVINLPNTRNKNKKPRKVPFASDIEAILRRHCENSRGPYVFVSPKDHERVRPVPPATFQNWIAKARERSGIVGFDGENVVLHTLRHAAVTDLLQARIDPTAIMAAAAMSPRTLVRYSKFGPEQQDAMRKHMEEQIAPSPPADRAGPRRAQNMRPGRAARR